MPVMWSWRLAPASCKRIKKEDGPIVAQILEGVGVFLVAARGKEDHHHEQAHEDAREHPADVEA